MPATFWQILSKKLIPRNKNIWIFAEICLEKLVKSHQVNLFYSGFSLLGTTVYRAYEQVTYNTYKVTMKIYDVV